MALPRLVWSESFIFTKVRLAFSMTSTMSWAASTLS